MIHDSPFYIYCFALPCCPSSSWLCEYYSTVLIQEVKVVKGALAEWGACSRTISFKSHPLSLAYQKDTFAVGLRSGEIAILDAITGSQVATLSGHDGWVRSLTFSLDGIFLVSGGNDTTVKLWDVQTGGVIKTFCGHTHYVLSVSVSPDCTTMASGSRDGTIRLWNIQAGDCFCVMDGFDDWVKSISFSPVDSQLLMSASYNNTVLQWDINGHQIGPAHEGKGIAFSLDGIQFVSWGGQVAIVRNSASRGVIADLQSPSGDFQCCCFSADGKSVAGSAGHTSYVWDITGSDPHLIKTLIGHTGNIISLIFPSSLISASEDGTIKFWQIGALSTDPATTNAKSIPLPLPSIESVSLQVGDGIAISSDFSGVVKTWDILTGLCKASVQTPAIGKTWRDVQLIEGKLVVVWYQDRRISIWDAEKGEFLQVVDTSISRARGIRISGDGSKVFCLAEKSIQAWSIWMGEPMGRVELEDEPYFDPLYVGGSKIWVCFKNSKTQGWDFGISGSSPIQLSNTFPDKPHLNLVGGTNWGTGPCIIKNGVTGKDAFQLVGRYATPEEVQWDGQYLIASYEYGEVLILDFKHVLPQ